MLFIEKRDDLHFLLVQAILRIPLVSAPLGPQRTKRRAAGRGAGPAE